MPFGSLALGPTKSNKIMFAITIASLLVTTTALIYAIYAHRSSKVEREPIFTVDPARTRILARKDLETTPIKVLKKPDNTEITSDLTAIRCYFWNNGKKSIKRENILEELSIKFDNPNSEIIDFKVLKSSRKVTDFRLLPKANNTQGVLTIDFSILEHNDGATFQITYAGPPDANVAISGIIEDVDKILANPSKGLRQLYASSVYVRLLFSLPNFVLACFFTWCFLRMGKETQKARLTKMFVALAIGFVLVNLIWFPLNIHLAYSSKAVTTGLPSTILP